MLNKELNLDELLDVTGGNSPYDYVKLYGNLRYKINGIEAPEPMTICFKVLKNTPESEYASKAKTYCETELGYEFVSFELIDVLPILGRY